MSEAAELWLCLGGAVGAAPSFGPALVVVTHALDPDLLLLLLFEGGELPRSTSTSSLETYYTHE